MNLAKGYIFDQHPLFKWFFCLIISLFIMISSPVKLSIITTILFLYLLIHAEIFKFWFLSLLRILPLIIAILIFSLLARHDFYSDLMLIARIILLLLISVFLIKTSSITELFSFLPERMDHFKEFLTATLLFIPIFLDSFTQAKKRSNNLAKIISVCLELTHCHIGKIRKQIEDHNSAAKIKYSWNADIIGSVLIFIIGSIYFY